MRRRQLLAAAALLAPCGAWAQPLPGLTAAPTKLARIGFLSSGDCPGDTPENLTFIEGLRDRGHVAGQNIAIECRYSSEASDEQFRRFAAELVRLEVDVIFAVSSTATRAVRPATNTLPVVALDLETDPVASGVARSLARPGGNITGIFLDALDFNAAFGTAAKHRVEALIVLESARMFFHRARLADLGKTYRLPTIGITRPAAEAGYLMAYAADLSDLHRRAARYVDKILKGAKPGDLPIERPTTFELIVNLKTAKALRLAIPPPLLLRADHVIE